MTQLLSLNARALLTAAITNVATSIPISAATADAFPICTTGTSAVGTGGLDWCKCCLEDSSGNIEVIYVRSRAGGVATLTNVIRGQEGTTARAYAAGDVIELRVTATDLATVIAFAGSPGATGALLLATATTKAARLVMGGAGEVALAAAATVDIGNQIADKVYINSGTGTITSLGTAYNSAVFVRMGVVCTLQHNATTLICPGGADIVCAAGDSFIATPKGLTTADGWEITTFTRAASIPFLASLYAALASTPIFTGATTGGVTAKATSGVATVAAEGSGTNDARLVLQNTTNGERVRVSANNARSLIVSADGGTSAHLTLDASGNLTALANVSAYSDERLKVDWASLGPDFVAQLASVLHGSYTRVDTGARQVGVGARSLLEVMPEAVSSDDSGFLSVAYGNAALAACVALAQELMALRGRLDLLENLP